MYEHIKGMAASLESAGLAKDGEQVQLVLAAYWADKVAVVWTTEDVHSVQDDFGEDVGSSSLSNEQAQNILQKAFDKHDASEGITWESLRYWSEEICS